MFGEFGPKLKSWVVAKLMLIANNINATPLTIQAAPGQSANLMNVQTTSGVITSGYRFDGGIFLNTTSSGLVLANTRSLVWTPNAATDVITTPVCGIVGNTTNSSIGIYGGTIITDNSNSTAPTLSLIGNTSAASLNIRPFSASNPGNTIYNAIVINCALPGTAAAGLGNAILFQAQDSTTAAQNTGRIESIWTNATHATRTGRINLKASDYSGTDREGIRVESNGSATMLGFFATTAVVQPTGDVPTALAALGLVASPTITVTGTRVSSSSGAFDLSTGNWFYCTLTGANNTFTLSNVPALAEFTIEIINSSSGGQVPTWFSTITWLTPNQIAPVIATGPLGITIFRFKQTATNQYEGWLDSTTLDYPSTILGTSGLLGYWELNDASGTTAIDQKALNNGTYNGTVGKTGYLLNQFGFPQLGGSLYLNSTGFTSYVSIPALTFSSSITVECWVNIQSNANPNMLVMQNTVNAQWALLSTGALNITWRGGNTGSDLSTNLPSLNTWYHIVATQTGTNASIYCNGVLLTSTTGAVAIGTTGTTINIGCYGSGSNFFYLGYIQHVSIYNVALPIATVIAHYKAGVLKPPYN